MIQVMRQGDKILGYYKLYLSDEEIINIYPKPVKEEVLNELFKELKKDDNSELFTYNILEIRENKDLLGLNYEIIFEFIPDKNKLEEIRIITERLTIGL